MSGARVLVVDDEAPFAAVIAGYFAREGYEVSLASDGPEALRAARATPPDLVILDVMLPGLDGVEVCRRLRGFSTAYVLMLTARGHDHDKIVALGAGADDYVVKPASPREILARAGAMLRRPRERGAHRYEATAGRRQGALHRLGELAVDTSARSVAVGQREVNLTRIEFDLLTALVSQPRRAFTRRQLVDVVWGPDWVGDEHIVDVHIGHVRRKLGDEPGRSRFVRTVRGIGYAAGSPVPSPVPPDADGEPR